MENQIYKYTENASFQVSQQGNKLDILLMSWHEGYCKTRYFWILANSTELAQNFFAADCDWNSQIRNELLVFEDGYQDKNTDLFESIQSATFGNLILHKTLKEDIQDDLINFFASREAYATQGLPNKKILNYLLQGGRLAIGVKLSSNFLCQ